ncbi:MAG: hypothetical protein CSA84_07225 [Actinomycetales bacterium]|nr:MAG: hypothetical protein CSA84_07225 [Actinomycetales bacterium]
MATTRGLLLVRADPDLAAAWAASGLVAVYVAALGDGWTAIMPSDARAVTAAPYDDPVAVLLGRQVPRRLTGAIGVAQVGPRVVLSVVPHVLRPRRGWLVWEPGQGMVRVRHLAPATAGQLAATAGRREAGPAVSRLLHEARGTPVTVLQEVFGALGLPGHDLAVGDREPSAMPGARLVRPRRQGVEVFDRLAQEDQRWRSEFERS